VYVRRQHAFQPFLAAIVVLLGVACVPADARAQGFISPFIGFDFGGDSGCATAGECEDKNSNIGVAFGSLGTVFGFEAEFAYARDFFGDTPDGDSNVLTFMTNLVIGPKIGPVRPYVVGGVGLVKSHIELTGSSLLETDNNSFGWDMGGGLMVFFGEHVGVRGDLRWFATFAEHSFLGFELSNEKLNFQRAAAALVLSF
jgi:opacity protein-like surface antigen